MDKLEQGNKFLDSMNDEEINENVNNKKSIKEKVPEPNYSSSPVIVEAGYSSPTSFFHPKPN